MRVNSFFRLMVFSILFLYAQPDSRFRAFDWVVYHGPGIINSISEGYNYVYVGTENGGLKRFNTFSLNFDDTRGAIKHHTGTIKSILTSKIPQTLPNELTICTRVLQRLPMYRI